MIKTKNRKLYYILAILLLISSLITLFMDMKKAPILKENKSADTTVNYKINSAPLKHYEQGSIDSH